MAELPPFFAVGDANSITAVWDGPIQLIHDVDMVAEVFPEALPVLHLEASGPIVPGQPSTEGAHMALKSLELGTGLARSGAAGALITGPVSKSQLYTIGYDHPGQTEYVAQHCGVSPTNATMMLAGPTLRVVPVTVHVPYKDVPDLLSIDLIKARAYATAKGLRRDFGIAQPRLAIARVAGCPCAKFSALFTRIFRGLRQIWCRECITRCGGRHFLQRSPGRNRRTPDNR